MLQKLSSSAEINSEKLYVPQFEYLGYIFKMEHPYDEPMKFYKKLLKIRPTVVLDSCQKDRYRRKFYFHSQIKEAFVVTLKQQLGSNVNYHLSYFNIKIDDHLSSPYFEVDYISQMDDFSLLEATKTKFANSQIVIFVVTTFPFEIYLGGYKILGKNDSIPVTVVTPKRNVNIGVFDECLNVIPAKNLRNLNGVEMFQLEGDRLKYRTRESFYFQITFAELPYVFFNSPPVLFKDWSLIDSNYTKIFKIPHLATMKECKERIKMKTCQHYRISYRLRAYEGCIIEFLNVTRTLEIPCTVEYIVSFYGDFHTIYTGVFVDDENITMAEAISEKDHVILTAGILIVMNKGYARAFSHYVQKNMIEKRVDHILVLLPKKKADVTKLHKDSTVSDCYIIVNTYKDVAANSSYKPNVVSSYLHYTQLIKTITFGKTLTVYETSTMHEATVTVKGANFHGVFVLCKSMLKQSWNVIATSKEPHLPVVDLEVGAVYHFQIQISAMGSFMKLDLHCHDNSGSEVRIKKEVTEQLFCITPLVPGLFYCYVRFKNGLVRYHPEMLIASKLKVTRWFGSRVIYTLGVENVYVEIPQPIPKMPDLVRKEDLTKYHNKLEVKESPTGKLFLRIRVPHNTKPNTICKLSLSYKRKDELEFYTELYLVHYSRYKSDPKNQNNGVHYDLDYLDSVFGTTEFVYPEGRTTKEDKSGFGINNAASSLFFLPSLLIFIPVLLPFFFSFFLPSLFHFFVNIFFFYSSSLFFLFSFSFPSFSSPSFPPPSLPPPSFPPPSLPPPSFPPSSLPSPSFPPPLSFLFSLLLIFFPLSFHFSF